MEGQSTAKVRTLVKSLDLVRITGDDTSLERPVAIANINRPGLELTGYSENSRQGRLVILGDKGVAYTAAMSVHKQWESFDLITNEQTPAIAVTKRRKRPDVLKRYTKWKNFPIFLSSPPTYRLIADIVAFLDERSVASMCVHRGSLSIYGKGVLIRGGNGMRKNKATLELIKRGHLLMANDRVDCYRIHSEIVEKAPELLRGILEIRGVDIISVSRVFGVNSVLPKTGISFQVSLGLWKADQDYDRVGIEEKRHENILNISIPEITIPVREGRSMAAIIESAVTNYILFVTGMNSARKFERCVFDRIKKDRNEQQEAFMTVSPDTKTVLTVGPLWVTWYAVLILSGVFLAYFLSLCRFKKWRYKEEILENFFLVMLPIAIISARLYHVIFEWDSPYTVDPVCIFYIWEGGLIIHGGVTAKTMFGWFYFRRCQYNGLHIVDVVLPNTVLVQVIGHQGNFISQEAYDGVVDTSFYGYSPTFIHDHMYVNSTFHQPTFLYESVENLIGFVLIAVVCKKYNRGKRGDPALAYLAQYGITHFFIEGIRTDSLMSGGLYVAQLVSLLDVLIGILGILDIWDKVFKNIYPFKKHKPMVIFDLGGILVNTKELTCKSSEHTFTQYKPGYTLSEEEKQSFLGPTLKQSFLCYFKGKQVDEITACYRAYNHEHHNELARPIPHAKETLEYLKVGDYPLVVISNKLWDIVRTGLGQFDLESYFEITLGDADVEQSEPDPIGIPTTCEWLHVPYDDVVYAGDAPTDVEVCKKAGVFSVALVYEESRAQGMQLCEPCIIIRDMSGLTMIIKEGHG